MNTGRFVLGSPLPHHIAPHRTVGDLGSHVAAQLPLIERVFVTASLHRVHPGPNPTYLDKNFGALLSVWDRMFGSFREEDEMEDEEKIRNAIKNYRWGAVSNLICCDVVTAVSYCLFLMLSHGEKTVVTNGLLPLSVLWFGASSKAKGRYWNYAIWHAVWHVLSAALMAKVLIA